MKQIREKTAYRKGLKKSIKRGKDLKKLKTVLLNLVNDIPLPERCRPHPLTGDWQPAWECHIEPDWLLIYDYDDEYLYLIDIGTHSDLFK